MTSLCQRIDGLGPSLVTGPEAAKRLGIEDRAVYPWRGYLLDSSRTFWSVDTIIDLLSLLHRYHFTRLHWHLTDNSGWRIPVKGYPRVTEVSSACKRMDFAEYTNVDRNRLASYQCEWAGTDNSGYYTAHDIQRVLEVAEGYGIEIMPEVDLPGHAEAIILAYPELGNPEITAGTAHIGDPTPGKNLRNDLLWPSDEAFSFVEAAVDSICDLFPSHVVHIGGDECDMVFWEGSRSAQAWMKSHDVADGAGIQKAFTDVARRRLDAHGRTCAVWDEAVATGLREDDLVCGWQDGCGVDTARKSGNPWVFYDAEYLYLNREPSEGFSGAFGMQPPLPIDRILDLHFPTDPRMVGVNVSLWCEFIPTVEHALDLLFPRILAAAARAYWGNSVSREQLGPLVREEWGRLRSCG
ncbi:family 20 glycosylhydrolase [Cutibacterium sp.]|uniref:family 20 glycosylhydrolase n=1 Tax=Cutibacterium sp. TaxID=1912221 RepID=UPI0026DCE5DE|nr:family 20 glycosylhydrolase [Cutibacterium sp.]MDO4412747.1 family 20 glycosylhydrolase [Cutibacterium sp.]